jgi:superfamily II DNA helicase RecQ
MTRQEAEQILQRTFKLPKFYDEQWLTIEKILKGEKVLLIEKTGFGKSLCFQFPASIFKGTTVIFSPLIALMRDQVKKLTLLGISAKCINHEQTPEENSQIINEQKVFENGYLKTENVSGAFIYTKPQEISGKSVLLVDDIFDSGATIKEIGKILTNFGATKIAPIVIARTVGGDIV